MPFGQVHFKAVFTSDGDFNVPQPGFSRVHNITSDDGTYFTYHPFNQRQGLKSQSGNNTIVSDADLNKKRESLSIIKQKENAELYMKP